MLIEECGSGISEQNGEKPQVSKKLSLPFPLGRLSCLAHSPAHTQSESRTEMRTSDWTRHQAWSRKQSVWAAGWEGGAEKLQVTQWNRVQPLSDRHGPNHQASDPHL